MCLNQLIGRRNQPCLCSLPCSLMQRKDSDRYMKKDATLLDSSWSRIFDCYGFWFMKESVLLCSNRSLLVDGSERMYGRLYRMQSDPFEWISARRWKGFWSVDWWRKQSCSVVVNLSELILPGNDKNILLWNVGRFWKWRRKQLIQLRWHYLLCVSTVIWLQHNRKSIKMLSFCLLIKKKCSEFLFLNSFKFISSNLT